MLLGTGEHVKEGDEVRTTGSLLSVPVGEALLGRVVNALGAPIDGKGDIAADAHYPVEKIAPGIITRKSVSVPVQTGIMSIDAMIPIGRGQRELIIGDRSTGKTTIAVDTIISQAQQNKAAEQGKLQDHKPLYCIYVAIGQKQSNVARDHQDPRGRRRHGIHHHRQRLRFRRRGECSTSPLTPVAPSASGSWTRARTPSSCSMTFPSTPSPTARCP